MFGGGERGPSSLGPVSLTFFETSLLSLFCWGVSVSQAVFCVCAGLAHLGFSVGENVWMEISNV